MNRISARRLAVAAIVCLAAFTTPQNVMAQAKVGALTADQQAAIDSIDVREVAATVSFLASDEMAGRDTPSPQLRIASAFVAANFRAAGLEGGGKDGSFFQEHDWPMLQLPKTGIEITSGDEKIKYYGALMAGNEQLNVNGKRTMLKSDQPGDSVESVVVIDEVALSAQYAGIPQYVLSMYSRRTTPLAKKGAKVVLVQVASDSPLREIAQQLAAKPMAPPRRFRFPCPIVLVGTGALPDNLTVKVPPIEKTGVKVRNVMGVLKGSDPGLSKEAIVVSAHLDHIGIRQSGQDTINNGADDNASGVTGVLKMAETFGRMKTRPKRTLIFMTFWGEEKGLLGSKHFVQNPLWPLERIVANVNLEMLGRPEENAEHKAWMTGWTESDLGSLMAIGAKRAGVEIFDHKQHGARLYRASDNFPFVQEGVVAHSFSAGSLHADYHQPSDEWEKLNLPHMTKVIQGLVAGVLPLANGVLTPKKTR